MDFRSREIKDTNHAYPPNHFHRIFSIQSPVLVGCMRLRMKSERNHSGKQTYSFLCTIAAAMRLAANGSSVTPGFADLMVCMTPVLIHPGLTVVHVMPSGLRSTRKLSIITTTPALLEQY